jgi:hypothetical protein
VIVHLLWLVCASLFHLGVSLSLENELV